MMILNYLFLLCAIILEVTGTLLLPISENFTKVLPTVGLTLLLILLMMLILIDFKTTMISMS